MFYDIYLYTLCYYICCLLGACMRCTWLCSLKPGVTGWYLHQKYYYTIAMTRYSVLSRQRRGIYFFVKREKKGRCCFTSCSKTVCTKVSRITKKYITLIHIQIFDNCFLQKLKLCTKTLNFQIYKASVFF
jgi:hypothetical protein